jgi:hypothetical protein
MGILLIIVVLAVVCLAGLGLAGGGARTWAKRWTAVSDELARPDSPTLDYVVPEGQDPPVVLAALSAEGYSAAPDPDNVHLLHISCPAGPDRDRARVRSTIAGVHTTAIDAGVPLDPGEVRFVDEEA